MDLVIVGNQADRLAQAIVADFAQLGKNVKILDVLAAAQLFTIEITNGKVAVTPDIPLIIRPFSSDLIRKDFDQSFHYSESLSTLWAVACSSKAPVLNRPTPRGMWSLSSFSSVLTRQRANFLLDTKEIFTRNPPELAACDLNSNCQWYLQDCRTYESIAAPRVPEGNGPYRSRQALKDLGYELVVVFTNQAWRSTQVALEHLNLESRSIQLVRNLNLDFGVVLWSIQNDLTIAEVAKVESFPSLEQVALVWSELATSLYKVFFS